MSKREPTAAQARYRMGFKVHAVPDSAKKTVSRFNRLWLGKVMAFVAVFSLVTSSFLQVPLVTRAAAPNWDATGNYVVKFTLGASDYNHNVSLTQTGAALAGNGSHAAYVWGLTSGSVDGDTITFTANYSATADAVTPLTTMNVTGTIIAGGTMSGTWTDNYQGGSRAGTWETTQGTAAPIVVNETSSTVVITGNTTNTENTIGKWMFNRDTSTDTPFEFNFDEDSIGDGSLFVKPITNTLNSPPAYDKMIAEYFMQEPIADIDDISYDFMIGTPDATVEEQFYLNVYANFGSSSPTKFYDCRYSIVPTIGSTGGFTTVTFDPDVAASSVATRGEGDPSPFACPAVPSDMNLLSASSTIRVIAINVGDTSASDNGVSGYLDNVVVDLNDSVTTYDFEPKTPTDVTILKVWQDANGAEIPAPSNMDDITINVETEENDDITCQYDDGDLYCDDEVESFSGETIEVTETGIPAGWVTDPTTVGDVTPVCEDSNVVNKVKVVDDNTLDCTHTVINKRVETPVCATELVVNGGFETPEVTNFLKFQYFSAGDANLGWSVDEANNNNNALIELHEGFSTWNAHGGNQYAELDSTKSTKIYQDLPTRNGGVYNVSLWTSPRPLTSAAENKVEVKMGGQILDTITSNGLNPLHLKPKWTQHTYSFTATGPITRLEITDRGNSNAFGSFVDDVSVIEECISDVTVCKLDQNQNPLSGWDVMLKGDKLETVNVPAIDEDGVTTTASLEAGQDYLFVATGTADAGDGIEFDADYSFRTGSSTTWTDAVSTYEGLGDQLLDLQVNGATVAWDDNATYNTNHKYNYFFSGADSTVTFRINDTFASNNSGSLSVDIYPVIQDTTGENGCVILENVDYGSYKLDELMKDGWINLSGQNTTALVDAPTETFTLVNKCTKACESLVKVCKVDNNGNELSGWNVFLKGPRLEKLTVDSDEVAGTTSNQALVAGQEYVVEISGEWQNRGFETVDASYTTPDGWTNVLAAPQGGYPDDLLETQIDNAFVNWGPYSGEPDHLYSLVVTGDDTTANFRVYDMASGNPTDMDASWYGDNFGELEVEIYPIFQGVTGNDGCVFLQDVPFGTYTLGETMQEGWANVRGEGSTVIVNEPSEPGINEDENPFILVNECTGDNCQAPEACVADPITVTSGAMTRFDGLKEGSAPLFLNSAASYPSGTTGNAVGVSPTGYAGAWDGAINDPDFASTSAVYVSNSVTQPSNSGGPGFDGTVDSYRLFRHNFTIPVGATGISTPILHYAADNEVTVFLDNVQIGFSASFNSVTDSAPLVLTPGTHTLEFAVKNYAFAETNNPTGVIYKLDTITYTCPTTTDTDPDNDVHGIVYGDTNDNGSQDEEETGLEGMTVKLLMVTDSNPSEEGTPLTEEEVATDVSDADGYYEFANVADGCYIVRELPEGYEITEPVTTYNEYYVQVGDADCDFNQPSKDLFNFLFNTADAAQDTAIFVAYDASQSLDFGNFDNSQGGNGGNGGSSGSRRNNDSSTPPGQVLGDSTTTPSNTPPGQVLGATTLPVTGFPVSVMLTVMAFLALIFAPVSASLKIKKN